VSTEERETMLETFWKPNPALADQTLGGKSVLLDYDSRRILGLNSTGSRIWALLDGTRTLGDVCRVLAREHDMPLEDVIGDVEPFVRDLVDRELLVAS
jgi:hypothetical protein